MTEAGRDAVEAELRPGADRRDPASSCSPARTPTPSVVDRATAAFDAMIADAARQRRPRPATTSPSPAPTTGSGTRSRSSRCATPRRSSTTTRNDMHRAGLDAPGSAPATRSPRRSTWSAPAASARTRTATTTSASSPTSVVERVPDARAPAVPGADPAGRGRALATCRSRAARRCTCRTPTSTTPGYLAWRRPEFRDYFLEHYVQLPLAQGRRGVLQPGALPRRRHQPLRPTSSRLRQPAPGLVGVRARDGGRRPRSRSARAIYPALLARKAAGADGALIDNAVAASAEGYPFPTNLDRDQPVDGRLTPPRQADLVRQALAEDWTPEALGEVLDAYDRRRRTTTTSDDRLRRGYLPARSSSSAAAPRASACRRRPRRRPRGRLVAVIRPACRGRRGARRGPGRGDRSRGVLRRRRTSRDVEQARWPRSPHGETGSDASTAWSTSRASPPAARCSTPRPSCSTSTSR